MVSSMMTNFVLSFPIWCLGWDLDLVGCLVAWLLGCFGLKRPLEIVYWAVSQTEGERKEK